MRYAVDTNTVSYFLRGRGRVAEHWRDVPRADLALPAVALYELRAGVERAASPRLREAVETLAASMTLLPFGDREAAESARIRAALESVGTPIGPMDVLIAGTTLAHERVLVTHNTSEFGRVEGLRLEDWF